MVISPGDYPNVKTANEVLADLLKRIGMNVDYISMDWSSMTQRGDQQGTAGDGRVPYPRVERAVAVDGLAAGEFAAAGNGGSEESGWYSSARYEDLRTQWMVATDPTEQARLDAALQRECLETVPLVPAGVTLQPAAWRGGSGRRAVGGAEVLERAPSRVTGVAAGAAVPLVWPPNRVDSRHDATT